MPELTTTERRTCSKCKQDPSVEVELLIAGMRSFTLACDEHRLEAMKESMTQPNCYVIVRHWFPCVTCQGRGAVFGKACSECEGAGGAH